MEKKDIAEKYILYLTEEGYRPTIDKDGDVQFKSEGLFYVVIINPQDETYLQIICPNIWPIENEEERVRVVRACNEANGGVKVAKTVMVRDNVFVSGETFLVDSDKYKPVLPRLLRAMQLAVNVFRNEMSSASTSSSALSAREMAPTPT